MAIRYDGATGLFSLTTAHTLYQMRVDAGGVLTHLYYGRDTDCDMGPLLRRADRGFSGNPYEQRGDRSFSLDTLPQEYSGSGVGDYRVSAVRLTGPDGSRSVDVRCHSHRIVAGKPRPEGLPWARPDADTETLVIELRDPVNGLRVELTYAVYPARDVITRSARLVNGGEGSLTLEAAASMCLDFPDGDLDVLHFPGRYAMERAARRERLPQGVTAFGSRRGMSSHHHNPFLILCERGTGEDVGNCWGFMLAYSGSHQEAIEVDHAGGARLVMGVHPDDFAWPLKPGEAFQTPEVLLSWSDAGFNGLSANFHALLRDDVMPTRFRHAPRPLLINSWEAMYFDFDADRLVHLAAQGKELGMDMLVLDDGWFGRRTDDNSSLGDWRVNEAKLGCGLGELSDRVHALGMKFGLWIEPEMVSEDSDLYRAPPDWALQDPGRRPMLSRNQLALDMSRDDVVDHLFNALCAVLDSAKIEYVKWDFNRPLANLYSHALPADEQGTVGHRCVLGTYRLLERLTERYPDLLIEGRAGGGGRVDAGMLGRHRRPGAAGDPAGHLLRLPGLRGGEPRVRLAQSPDRPRRAHGHPGHRGPVRHLRLRAGPGEADRRREGVRPRTGRGVPKAQGADPRGRPVPPGRAGGAPRLLRLDVRLPGPPRGPGEPGGRPGARQRPVPPDTA